MVMIIVIVNTILRYFKFYKLVNYANNKVDFACRDDLTWSEPRGDCAEAKYCPGFNFTVGGRTSHRDLLGPPSLRA